jgi:hypothetical protein
MHGVQGPGGPRWGIAPGRGGYRSTGRDVYVRRRILAVLVVLLLLALLIPRACEALLGSNEGTGSREHQRAGAPETATGTGGGAKDAGKTATKDAASERGAPFVESPAGSEGTSGAATTDFTAMIVGPAVIGADEPLAVEDATGDGSGTDQGAQAPAGPSLAASRQTVVAPRNAPETSRAQRPPSDTERAPAHRQVLSNTAVPVKTPTRDRPRGGRDLAATVPVAVEPVAVEPVAVEPVAVEPVAVEPVAVEPVAVEPVPADTAFVPRDTSVGLRGAGTNFRGNAVGGAVNGRATFNRVGGALAGGPRRSVAGPVGTRRPAIF